MKTIPRRLLALLLTLAMAMSLLSISVWAADQQDNTVPLAVQEEEEEPSNEGEEEDEDEGEDDEGDDEDGDEDQDVTEASTTVNGILWSLKSGTLTISGSGAVDTPPDWLENAVFSYLVLDEGITAVNEDLFDGVEELTGISFPESLTSIGAGTFSACTGLSGLALPEGLTSIGEGAFSGCTGLPEVTIPKSVTTIGACAFFDCTGLRSVTLTDKVTSIGAEAFNQSGASEDDSSVPLSNFTLKGYANSYAEQYATNNNIPFEVMEKVLKLASVTAKDAPYTGEEQQPELTVLDEDGNEVPAECYEFVLDKTPVEIDTYTVTVTAKEKPYKGSVEGTFKILKQKKIAKVTIEDVTYTGEEQQPELTVLDEDGKQVAAEYYEFTLDRTPVNAGSYTVTVKGRGVFTNTLTETYRIRRAKLTELTLKEVTYNGSVRNPVKEVKAGNLKLKRSDYSVVTNPAKAKNAGSYQVKVTGKGNYQGTLTKTFTINKAKNTLLVIGKIVEVDYNTLIKKKQTFEVTKAITLKKSGQGKLSFEKGKGHKKITIDASSGNITVEKGLKKGTYRVQMIITAAGNKNFKKGSKKVYFTVWVKK